jgi:hypothetical protein
MKPESGMELITGLIRFYSMEEMRKYIKELLDGYQRELDRASNVIGSLLRDKGKKGEEIIKSRGWSKVGGIFVNSMEPELGEHGDSVSDAERDETTRGKDGRGPEVVRPRRGPPC